MGECDRWRPRVAALLAMASLGCDPGSPAAQPPSSAPAPVPTPQAAVARTVEVRDPQAPGPLRGGRQLDYLHPYRFEEDWFTHNIPLWTALLRPYAGRPGLRYLEVGLWEGRSFVWMLDHVVTHPTSHATGVDLAIQDDLLYNIELSGAADRVTTIEGSSQLELRKLPADSFDVVYIDGSHTAADVLEDIVLAWRLLEPGGLMILDDYRWNGFRDPKRPALPDELLPRVAIDAFISANRSYVEVVARGYQVALRKRGLGCPGGDSKCSSLGVYSYDWDEQTLYRDGSEVALSDAERSLVEALIRAKRGDALAIDLDSGLRAADELEALSARLDLRLW